MDIIIEVEEFECQAPTVGVTSRTTTNNFMFNWNWNVGNYQGVNALVQLFYQGDGDIEKEYTATPLPFIANNFVVTLTESYDVVNFRLVFQVDGGTVCKYNFNIPYSEIN